VDVFFPSFHKEPSKKLVAETACLGERQCLLKVRFEDGRALQRAVQTSNGCSFWVGEGPIRVSKVLLASRVHELAEDGMPNG
jgi:hypothetical protein